MVPFKVSGKNFAGLIFYLMHDKRTLEAQERGEILLSAARVGWVHTENLAGIENDILAARLMQETANYSERCKKPVYHLSLNWHPDQDPSREQMIEAGQSVMKHLGLEEHQAVFVAHTDTDHKHLHLVINRVHPEKLIAWNMYRDQKKLSEWALQYERDHGQVLCAKREEKERAREQAQERGEKPKSGREPDARLLQCWTQSRNGEELRAALWAKGFELAYGDRKDVLMIVAKNGKAAKLSRELKITEKEVSQKINDLDRSSIKKIREVQAEIEAKRQRGGERKQEQKPRFPANDQGKRWALEMAIRAHRRALTEKHEREREARNDADQARIDRAKAAAEQAQQMEQQQRALQEAIARLKWGGRRYRMSPKGREDAERAESLPQEIARSRVRVEEWIAREKNQIRPEREALWNRQARERIELEARIEQAQARGEWREERAPERSPQAERAPSRGEDRGGFERGR